MMSPRIRSLFSQASLLALGLLIIVPPDIGEAEANITIRGRSRSHGWRGWGGSSFKYKERGPGKDRDYRRKKRAENMEDAERRRVQAAEDEFWRKEYRVPAALGTVNVRHLSEEAKSYLETERAEEKQRAREREDQARRAAEAPPQQNVIEEAALNHVRAMSTYLQNLKHFSMALDDIREDLTPNGPVQVRAKHEYLVTRPDKLKLKSRGANGHIRNMRYDGVSFTIVEGTPPHEVEIPAEGTLDTLAPQLYASHRMVLPAGDLLHENFHELVTKDCSHAQYMGLHYIQGRPCHHVIGTTAGADWQLWIDSEGPPVPKRLLVRYRSNSGVPRYAVNITKFEPLNSDP